MHEARERWRNAGYPPQVIESLRWDRRYSLIRIGGSDFAFSRPALYVAALRTAWAAGFAPDQGPGSILGIDLPEVTSCLRGVDVEVNSSARSNPA